MLTEVSAIEGAYLRDILDQPRALEDTLGGLNNPKTLRTIVAKLHRGGFRAVVLTGMGSSFHALHPSNLELINHGFITMMVETSELVHYKRRLFEPKTLIIAVSQSGQSAEVVRLLEINRGRSVVIAVTNTADSTLAMNANATMLTRAGDEFSVSCKTYVTALIVLKYLTAVLCGHNLEYIYQELKQSYSTVDTYLTSWREHVQSLSHLLKGARHLFFVGRGRSLAAVGTGALIIKESDHFHAEGMSSAAFRHGPFEMVSNETFVLVFEGDDRTIDLNHRLLADIKGRNGRTELVSENSLFLPCKLPVAPESIRPILEILPVQMITLALAAQMGREPGRFEFASKVTTRE